MVIGGKPCRGRAFDLWDCHECFYEKVVKVKADVAAILINFFPRCISLRR
jgi:hypothetical protein